MAANLTDAMLLDRYATGREDAAFDELVRRHRVRVRASCRRLVDSEHDADDVVQATFLTLAQRAGEPSWRDSVGGWLCVVARRLAQDHREARARRGRRERPLDGPAGRLDPICLHDDPAADSLRRELRKAVREELGRLPEKYREPVVLCDLEGLSHQEAARRLGLPAGSMSRRLGKARSILRHRLSHYVLPLALLGLLVGWLGRGPSAPGGRDRTSPTVAATERTGPTSRGEGHRAIVPAEAIRISAAFLQHGEVDGNADAPALPQPASRELRLAALDLNRAARNGDPTSLSAASRRLDATCVRCHLASRQ